MPHTPRHNRPDGEQGGGGGGSQSGWDIAPPWGVVDSNDYIKGLQAGLDAGLLQQLRSNFTTSIRIFA